MQIVGFPMGRLICCLNTLYQSVPCNCFIFLKYRYEPMKRIQDLGDEIAHCTISPDGTHLAIGLDSGRICIWKLSANSVDLLHTISMHTSYIRDIEFNETGTRMASAGGLSLRIWNVSDNFKMISAYYGPVSVTCFLGDVIVAGEATGNLKYLSF